jgi:tRNA nucleotidyltransferase (CCA-adding enzyme)
MDLQPAHLIARLPADIRRLLTQVTAAAVPHNLPIWLVGGVVRDLLLTLPVGRDIDVAVEGDPQLLAAALATAGTMKLIAAHPRFMTVTVELDGFSLDLIRTRRETYRAPAALPTVFAADITADLLRRDFSVNALALRLTLQNGELSADLLADPTGGRADLQQGRLRLLHAHSLIDDPTRLLRGVRIAARLQLQPEPQTAAWIADAVAADRLATVSNERLQSELCLLLEEPDPAAVIDRAEAWGLRAHFCRVPLGGPQLAARLQRLNTDRSGLAADQDRHLLIAGLITADLDAAVSADLLARFTLPRPFQRLISRLPELQALLPELRHLQQPSRIDTLLQPFETALCAVVHYAAQPDDPAAARLAEYLQTLRPRRAPLDGSRLRQLGVPAGAALGACLRDLRAAFLDGDVTDQASAEAWVRRRLSAAVPVAET